MLDGGREFMLDSRLIKVNIINEEMGRLPVIRLRAFRVLVAMVMISEIHGQPR